MNIKIHHFTINNCTFYRENPSDLFESEYLYQITNWTGYGPDWNFGLFMDDYGNWQSNEIPRETFYYLESLNSYL